MEIRYDNLKKEEYRELEAMMLALYTEDDDGEAMDPDKIRKTVDALVGHPEVGRILLLREAAEETLNPPAERSADPDPAIGYAILVFCWNTEYGGRLVIIDDLYIKPEYRNRGIATRFFDLLTEEYGGKAVALMLEASPANRNAQRLYERYGFQPVHSVHMMKRI